MLNAMTSPTDRAVLRWIATWLMTLLSLVWLALVTVAIVRGGLDEILGILSYATWLSVTMPFVVATGLAWAAPRLGGLLMLLASIAFLSTTGFGVLALFSTTPAVISGLVLTWTGPWVAGVKRRPSSGEPPTPA